MARNTNIQKNRCPSGVLCIQPLVLAFGAAILLLSAYIVYMTWKGGRSQWQPSQQPTQPSQIIVATQQPPPTQIDIVADQRYSRAPRPEREWNPTLEIPPGAYSTHIPIGLHTRGLPESYQSMGVLRTESGQMIPLYGRRTAARADRFQYYTRTDTANPIPLPIQYKRRDCQDDIGCDELFDGERVRILPTQEEATATIYRMNGPMYVPGLV